MTPKRIARLREVLNRRQPDLTVVTDFVHKQRNLSAIVRNCDAVGIQRMHAVIGTEDYKTFRGTAMGSHHWVDVDTHQNPAVALDALKASGYQLVAATLMSRPLIIGKSITPCPPGFCWALSVAVSVR